MAIHNHTKALLAERRPAFGVGIRQARTPDIARIMKTAGYDWLFIDMEHNTMEIDTATAIAIAAQDAGITPITRVPSHDTWHATRALDGGAMGIVFPHVDDAETAKRLSSACRYPPQGHRSISGALPQINFAKKPLGEAAAEIDDALLLVLMLESPRAIENADEIAAVPGVDVLLIGSNDLSMEMGVAGELTHPRIKDAFATAARACERHGKTLGMGGIYKPEDMAPYREMGARLILSGSDLGFMQAGASAQMAALRGTNP